MQASHRTKLVQFRNSRLIVIFALINFLQCIAFTVAVPSFPFLDTQDDSQNSIDDPPNIIPGPHIGAPLRLPSADGNLAAEVDFQKSFHKGPTTTTPPPYYYTPPPYYTTQPPYYTTQPPYYSTPYYPTGNQPPYYPASTPPPYYQATPRPYYPPQQYQQPPHYAAPPRYQPPRNAPPSHDEPSEQSPPCAEHHDNQLRKVSPKFASYGWGM